VRSSPRGFRVVDGVVTARPFAAGASSSESPGHRQLQVRVAGAVCLHRRELKSRRDDRGAREFVGPITFEA